MKRFWNTRTQPQSTARDSNRNMWSIYEKEAVKYDREVTEAQKKDADGVLVFVGYNLLIVSSLGLTGSKDWPVLRSRRLVPYRKLQEVIP